jgi:hypothetical protein
MYFESVLGRVPETFVLQDHSDFGMFGGANIILVVLLNCVSFGNEISGSSRVEKKD